MELHSLTLGEYTAAYREVGQGLPMLCLHGFLGDSSFWQSVVEQLSSHYRCICLDLLGFGGSSKPQLNYVIDHQVDFLHQFVKAMGLEALHLLGYSYGGWVAAAYGIAHAIGTLDNAASLSTLTLVAPAGIRDDSFVRRYHYLQPLLWQSPVVDIALAAFSPVAQVLGQSTAYRRIRSVRKALIDQPVARSYLINRLRPEDAIDTVEQKIHHITTPTLVIAGEADETIPLWHCQTYADRIPHSHLKILPNARHNLLCTHSQTIADLLKANLSRDISKGVADSWDENRAR